jgi:hypothetical protein
MGQSISHAKKKSILFLAKIVGVRYKHDSQIFYHHSNGFSKSTYMMDVMYCLMSCRCLFKCPRGGQGTKGTQKPGLCQPLWPKCVKMSVLLDSGTDQYRHLRGCTISIPPKKVPGLIGGYCSGRGLRILLAGNLPDLSGRASEHHTWVREDCGFLLAVSIVPMHSIAQPDNNIKHSRTRLFIEQHHSFHVFCCSISLCTQDSTESVQFQGFLATPLRIFPSRIGKNALAWHATTVDLKKYDAPAKSPTSARNAGKTV